jgi:hypothetical protein
MRSFVSKYLFISTSVLSDIKLAPRRGHGLEVESGFSSLRIWQDRDRERGRSGGGCSRAGEVEAEATDHAEVVLVLEKWRLFSVFHQFQQRKEKWRSNRYAKSHLEGLY